jgi:hypothetical protein
MNINVHYPRKQADLQELNERIAYVHSKAILNYIEHLSCPLEQKQQILLQIMSDINNRKEKVI